MTVSRRFFLGFLGAAGCSWAHGESVVDDVPRLRFGVLSDSHTGEDVVTMEPLRRIFGFFARANVDAVCHAGDICHLGNFTELGHVAAAWANAFPQGRNAAGNPVTPIFVFGNHDYHAASFQRGKSVPEGEKAQQIVFNKARAWKMLTGEDGFPGEVFARTVKGYTFVGTHWGHEDEIAGWFATHPDDGTKPIFHIRHPHPSQTCFGAWSTGSKKGCEALQKRANVFVMSGHSHINVGNDNGLWLGAYASMGCGSAYLTSPGNFDGAYDNTTAKHPAPGQYWHTKPSVSKAWQASVVTVYDHRIMVERYDFASDAKGEALGEPWLVAWPFQPNAARPYVIAEAAAAPQFAPSVQIDCVRTKGTRRPDKVEEQQVQFVVSESARADGPHARPAFYRFELFEPASGKVWRTRAVIQNGWCKSEARSARMPVTCAFAATELAGVPACAIRVTPQNAAGRPGRPIVSKVLDWTKDVVHARVALLA